VAVNEFEGHHRYPPGEIRSALDLAPDTPLTVCDARDRSSSIKALITLVEYLTSRPEVLP
jgi:signal recognition particle receptor subunit beta